jgi:glycosyltransferase involved in cell wall biosynthesis
VTPRRSPILVTLFINGKFTAQSMTGVQRAAHETVLAIDRLLERRSSPSGVRWVLLCPPGGQPPLLRHVQVCIAAPRTGSLFMWEQSVLPWAARGGWLLNLAGSAPWWATRRSVCSVHDAAVFDHPETYTALFRLWYRMQFRHMARRAGGLLTVSEFSRARMCALLGLSLGRFRVLPNGADHFERVSSDRSILAQWGLEPGRFLLVVGTAKRTKNIGAVLDAWRHLPQRAGRRLVWVGGVNSRVFADESAAHADLAEDRADGTAHLGVIPDSQLKALYEAAAGLVIASLYEGFGFPAVEAMSCGCAVASASAAALPEVCADAAVYFEPQDRDSIAHAMCKLLDDEALRRVLGERGRARAAAFRWDSVASGVAGYLSELGAARLRPN